MSLQKNLLFLLKQKDLNANSLKEKSNGELAQPTTRRILNGESENIRDVTLEKYAQFFGIQLIELKYGNLEQTFKNKEKSELLQEFNISLEGDALHDGDVEVPFFKEVLCSADSGVTQVIEESGRKLRLSKKIAESAGVDPDFAAGAINQGKSMETTILDKAELGIDKSKKLIKDGKIYAFDHGGMLRVKRLYRLPYGAVRIVSDNENKTDYPDEVLTAEEWESQVKLLGWVFWWSTVDTW